MPLSEPDALELAAVDAALAGEPVDPRYAELAELSVLLAASAPQLPAPRAAELDRRVGALSIDSRQRATGTSRSPRRRPWFLRPAYGAGLAIVLALAVLVIVLPRGGASPNSALDRRGPTSYSSSSGASAASSPRVAAATSTTSQASASAPASAGTSGDENGPLPTPQANGRRSVQSSQLTLTAAGSRVATVVRELFDVVGSERGIVKHSQVTTGISGYASFTLSIPTANLSGTLASLAQLRYATVASSSASSTDVNRQYLDDQRRLADAKALRSSLLTQLQAADSTAAVDSLKQQITDAESAIAADEAALNGLSGRISFSAVDVTITPGSSLRTPTPSRSGFSLSRAAHDALNVLKVATGVALIGLAMLFPLGLLGALALWSIAGWRRLARRRALDGS
jgi:hypothetical protein